jgi:hypothetical protein
MSSRAKRKFDIDPNASDPDDYDYDATERPTPQRRRNRGTPGVKKKSSKRQRRAYGGSDVDEDDEIVSDDSFTDRSESEEPEINPATGRSVRRATKKQIKYEESEEDEIEDTPSEGDDDDKPISTSRRRAKPSVEEVEKPSLIVKLKMPDYASGRNLRTRTGSKSIARGKTPEVAGTRRSSRLSHDIEAPIVALSDSGKHVNIVRDGTRSPEPVISRATRGGKGPRVQHHSAIMEASQETSMLHEEDAEDTPGPLDGLLHEAETQVQASKESSPIQEAQDLKGDDEDEEEGMGVIQESQHEGAAEDSDEEDGPVTRGGRSLRVSVLD